MYIEQGRRRGTSGNYHSILGIYWDNGNNMEIVAPNIVQNIVFSFKYCSASSG